MANQNIIMLAVLAVLAVSIVSWVLLKVRNRILIKRAYQKADMRWSDEEMSVFLNSTFAPLKLNTIPSPATTIPEAQRMFENATAEMLDYDELQNEVMLQEIDSAFGPTRFVKIHDLLAQDMVDIVHPVPMPPSRIMLAELETDDVCPMCGREVE